MVFTAFGGHGNFSICRLNTLYIEVENEVPALA
jgi:hypothetical protein